MFEISHVSVCASDFAQQMSAVPRPLPAVLEVGQDGRSKERKNGAFRAILWHLGSDGPVGAGVAVPLSLIRVCGVTCCQGLKFAGAASRQER